ncbi:MAG TPA: hypothetical protein VFE96_04410 [Candidatus Bathyarchaeia archaeon]|nr:hypothetical protein [Candidatus Bathyarchaeia archaeon]
MNLEKLNWWDNKIQEGERGSRTRRVEGAWSVRDVKGSVVYLALFQE